MARFGLRRSISASIQALEPRQLLAADTLQVLIGSGAAKSVQYTDPNGTVVRIQLTGPGSASVNVAGTGLGQSSNARGIVVSGSGVTLSNITAGGTQATTSLQIVTTGKKTVNIGNITVAGSLASLSAPKCILTGPLMTTKWVGLLSLAGAQNSNISIGPAAASGAATGMVATLGTVSNETFQSAVRISTLTASQWINPRGVGSTTNLSEITAPFISTLTIAHDASVNIQSGSVNALTVRGTLSNSNIYLTTPLTPLKLNMTQFTTGALQSVIVTSNGNLGGIFTKRMTSSSIEAGIVATVAPLSLPLTTSDFKNTASIAAITIPKSASASFSNSYVAAYTINSASLGSVSMTNNTAPGTPFGIAAHKVSFATLFVQQGGNKQVHVTNPATNAVFDNVLTAKGITPADFEVRVV